MILVTGATGQLGGATIDFLLKKVQPGDLAALARDPDKARSIEAKGVKTILGNYDDPASLEQAFSGIDKLLFVSSNEIPIRDQQHANVVAAAKKMGVGHIVYTSFQRTTDDESALSMLAATHIFTENLIKESGLTYTLLRNALYSDALPMLLGEPVIDIGTIFFPAGEGGAPFASRNDMAEATANVLTGSGHENQIYPFVASESYSFADIASMLSGIAGKTINYISPEAEVYRAELAKVGVPEAAVELAVGLGLAMQQGLCGTGDPTLGMLLGRKPASPREILEAVYLQ